jgi:hypothetical protein
VLLDLVEKRPICTGKLAAFLKLLIQSSRTQGKRLDLFAHTFGTEIKHRSVSFRSLRKTGDAERILPP